MGKDRKIRFLVDIFLVFSVLYLPWFIAPVVAFCLAIYLGNFYEMVLVGLAIDLIYGPPSTSGHFRYLATTYCAALLALTYFIRRRIAI